MEDNLLKLHTNLVKEGYELPDFNTFKSDMSDPVKSLKLHDNLTKEGYDIPDYDTFIGDMGLIKKKVSSEDAFTSASGKEEIPFLGMSGQNPQPSVEPSTPQSQSISGKSPKAEAPKAKTVKDYIAAFGAETGKGFAELSDMADKITTMGSDAINQLLLGKDSAVEIKKLREEGLLSPALGGGLRPFEALTKAINYTTGFAKPLPEATKKQRIIKGALQGAGNVIPLALTSTLFPEIKAAQVLQNAGIEGLSKFGMLLGTQKAVRNAEGAESGTTLQKVVSPFVGAMEGVITGQAFDALGTMSGKIGSKIANKIIPTAINTSQALTKGLAQQAGSGLADAVFFGTYGNLEEYLQTGKISEETFASNAAMGMLLRTKDIGKLMWAKGVNTIIGADREAINNAIESKTSAEDMAKRAQEKVNAVEQGTSTDKEQDVVDAFVLAKASQMKAVADEVVNNTDEVRQSIEESALDGKAKEIALDKVNQIAHDNDPKAQAIQSFNDNIDKINESLDKIMSNKSLSEVEKEAQSAPLKEKKLSLKEQALEAYNKVKPEERSKEEPILNIGGQENAQSNGGSLEKTGEQAQGLEQGTEGSLHMGVDEKNRVETGKGEEITETPFDLREKFLTLQKTNKNEPNGKEQGEIGGSTVGISNTGGEISTVPSQDIPRINVGRSEEISRYDPVKEHTVSNKEASEIQSQLPNAVFDDNFIEVGSAEEFYKAISESKLTNNNKFGASVWAYTLEEYKNSRLFLTKDGKAGLAITKEGDIISVFSYGEGKGRVPQLIINAIKEGGVSLYHYNTILTEYYSKFGFVPVARVKWNDEYAPSDWNKSDYKKFNNREPDVIAMAYHGGDPNTLSERVGRFGDPKELVDKTPYVNSWDEAKKLQRDYINKVKNPQSKDIVDNFMSDKNKKDIPEGVKEQIKEYEKPGELQKGWEDAINTIPKKEIGTTPDGRKVFVVSGTDVRDKIYTNWTEGGNDSAYPWMPKGELWVEDVESAKDKIADLIHESGEQKDMQDNGSSYDKGHEVGLADERKFRETGEIPAELKPIADQLSQEPVAPLENKPEMPVEGNKQPVEPLSPESGTIQPPPPEVPGNAPKPPRKVNEREKALLNRMHNAEKLSGKLKDEVEKKGLTYEQISNDATSDDVDYLIADKGLEASEKEVFNTSNKIEPRVRALAATRLVKTLDELAESAETPQEEYDYRKRSVDMADFIDNTARDWGRGIQILGSAEVNDMLAPKTQVIRIKKEVRRQRDTQIENNKDDITKKKKELDKANKESVNEVIDSQAYEDLKKRVEELENKLKENPKPRKTTPAEKIIGDKIKKEQEYRKIQWDILKKPSDTASVSAIGLSKEQIEAVGNIVASYVREGYFRTEDLVSKLKKDWFKNTGSLLSDEDARKLLPEKVDEKKLTDIEAEGESKEAADKLASRIDRMLQDPKAPKDDPVKQMIDILFEKVKEKDTKEKVPIEKKSALDKIRETLENKDEYADVWEEAKEKVVQKINTDSELSEEQRSDYNKRLAGFYEEVIGKPFSERQTEQATKKGLKDMGVSIDKVIKDHYTVYDATKRTLQEKLIDELGMSGENAKMVADAVGKQFDKIAIARKKAILKSGITPKEIVKPKQAKQLHDKLIELTNLGAFSDAEFSEAYADKWGFPKLEPEQAKEIERLAKLVQDAPEGYQKFERIQDLLAYTENVKGMDMGDVCMSMWYSSILSGYRTQAKNFVQNSITSLFEGAVSTIQNPLNTVALWRGLTTGWGEGLRQFGHIMKTGYNPIKGYKVEVPSTQERFSFKGGNANPANWGKYVTRIMVAADAFSYSGLKEMRSYEIAMNEARKLNKNATEPTKSTWAVATELLNKTSDRVAVAEQTATNEGLKGVEYKRRVWELMEQGRTKEMVEDAAHFAAHGTFNYAPEGALGMTTEFVSHLTQDLAIKVKSPFSEKTLTVRPAKFIIPFTRIIANVTNMALDYYPPVGLGRAALGGIGAKGFELNPQTAKFYRQYTPEERTKVLTKAMIGVAAQVGLYMLTQPDKDGKSTIEITANGYGDYQKNYELKELGWQPYSIKIGDKWFSYQYSPLILALAPLGYLRDMQVYNKEKVKDETLASMIGLSYFKGIQVITDMTWASSLNSLMQGFTAKDPAQAQSFMKNLTASTAKSFMYPKLAEQITQLLDAAQQNPRRDAKDLMGKILRDIPIVRNKYNIMLNAVGEPIKFDPLQMTANVKHDPFWEWVTDKNITIGKPDQKAVFYDDITKTERGMTNQEYYDFVKTSGPEIKRRIEEEVIPESLSLADAKKAVSNIKTEVRQATKTEMFGWGDLRKSDPANWDYLKKNGLLQVPHTSEVLRIGNKKVSLSKEQLQEFNNNAINIYVKLIHTYIDRGIDNDKTKIQDPFTGTTVYDYKVKTNWEAAVTTAKAKMKMKLTPSK